MDKTNETNEANEIMMSPEQIAEMEALKNQELFGEHVQKIGGCAVITVEDEVVSLELPITYPQLVSAIIKRKYDSNESEAITANYISIQSGDVAEDKAAEYTAEYQTYQTWRNIAKNVAKEVMGINA